MAKDPYKKPANVGALITTPAPTARVVPPFIPTQGGVRPGGAPGPAQWQDQSDNISQWIRPGVSQVRFPALPVKANPQGNTVARSTAKKVVAPYAAQTATNTAAITALSESVFLGNWSSTLSYVRLNQVLFNGAYYICLIPNTNQQPDTHPLDWQTVGNGNYIYTGPYSNTFSYQQGNETTYLGSYWICVSATTGNAPAQGSSYWTLVGTSSILLGAFSGSTAYVQGNEVTYQGNIYQCILASTGNLPTNTTYFQLLGPTSLDFLANGAVYLKGIGTVASESITIENNNFEASASLPVPGWTNPNGATLSYNTASPQSGNQSLGVTGNNVYAATLVKYACSPGDSILIGGYAKSDGTAIPFIYLTFFNAAGSGFANGGVTFTTSTTWSSGQTAVTVPANTVYFQITLYNTASSGTAYFDNIYCDKVVQLGSNVVDGAHDFSAKASTLSYAPTTNPLSSVTSGGNAVVNIASFVLQTSSKGSISYNSGSISALAQGTALWICVSDATLAGGTQTFSAYTSKSAALASGGFFIGSIITATTSGVTVYGANDGGSGNQTGYTLQVLSAAQTNPFNPIDGPYTSVTNTTGIGTSPGLGNADCSWQNFIPQLAFAPATITLYVQSQVTTAGAGTPTCILAYSTDGGSTFTNLYSVGAARGLTIDSVSIPASTPMSSIVVKGEVSHTGAAGSITQNISNIYLAVQV